MLKETKEKRTKAVDLIYQWRSKVKAKQTNEKLAKFRVEQREAAELDPRRAAALGAIFSLANAKKDSGGASNAEDADGDPDGDAATSAASASAATAVVNVTNKSALTFIDIVKGIRVDGQKGDSFDKVKEKEIATKKILKSGIGVHLLEAVKKTRERQAKEKQEKEIEEERRRKEREERDRKRAERERLKRLREQRKAKESIIVVEEVDSPLVLGGEGT